MNFKYYFRIFILIVALLIPMVVTVPWVAWAVVDGCGDGSGGSQDIDTMEAWFEEATGVITVELTLCAPPDDRTKYWVHFDHTAPFANDCDRNGDTICEAFGDDFCVTTSDDTMMHRNQRDTGPGTIIVDGNIVTYSVNIAELNTELQVGDMIYVWSNTQFKGIVDRTPDTNATDGCGKPETLTEYVELLLGDALEVTVTNVNDSGPGSLRNAVDEVAEGGSVFFDPGLAGSTITLTSGPLTVDKIVTIDGSGAPGLTLSGGGTDRVLIIDATGIATISYLTIADGYGWQLAGGILNNGMLILSHVTVTGNMVVTDAGDFWQGGGGIYNGSDATLNLIDSTVMNNTSEWTGGGIFSFFNTITTIVRSTIAANVSNDVGGGIRSFGNAEIVNSTISGNSSLGWYGGAIFQTDGVMDILNSTIVYNIAPTWAPEVIFIGTFGPANATLTLTNSIVASNSSGCFVAPWGAGTVILASGGHNIGSDSTCNMIGPGDQVNTDPIIGPLADNGGPTLTHALLVGSPAIDAADDAVCPVTDQRDVARPQGAACDVGAYEFVP